MYDQSREKASANKSLQRPLGVVVTIEQAVDTDGSLHTGSHIPEGAELFYVKLHSTLTMTCSFGSNYESARKFLCRMAKTGCFNIIDSYGNVDEDYTGRALLSNMKDPGSFSIMITQMNWEDSGLYLCGVGDYGQNGETKELDVHVYEGKLFPEGFSLRFCFSLEASLAVSCYLTGASASLCRVLLSHPLIYILLSIHFAVAYSTITNKACNKT